MSELFMVGGFEGRPQAASHLDRRALVVEVAGGFEGRPQAASHLNRRASVVGVPGGFEGRPQAASHLNRRASVVEVRSEAEPRNHVRAGFETLVPRSSTGGVSVVEVAGGFEGRPQAASHLNRRGGASVVEVRSAAEPRNHEGVTA